MTSEGVWHIRRREKAQVIEVFKVEESGHGGILSKEYLQWKTTSPEQQVRNLESVKSNLLDKLDSEPVP